MDFGSFLLSVVTWFAIFVILLLLFTWLSRNPGNKVVYFSNRILSGSDPYPTRNPFQWIQEAFGSNEKDVNAASGVDSAVYLVFLSTVLKILLLSGVVLLPLLLPLAATESIYKSSVGTFNNLNKLSMAPVKKKSIRLWAFVAATYWVSIVAYVLLWKAYKRVSEMRSSALVSPEFRAEQFAILVRDIPTPPTPLTQNEYVDSFFRSSYPETFYKSLMVAGNIGKVNKIHKKLEECKKKLARAEAAHNEPKKIQFNEKINELTLKLEAEQKANFKPQTSAFVFFTSRVAAASAAQNLRAATWTVMDAPAPNQIIWNNLSIKSNTRKFRRIINGFIIFVSIIIYMGLVLVASAFSVGGIGSGAARTATRAYLPQIILIISMVLLSKFLYFLSKSEGKPSTNKVVSATSRKYFWFTLLNFFGGFTFLGTIYDTFDAINHEKYDAYLEVLSESLPTNAIFFMTFVALMLFVGYGLELSQIIPLLSFHLKKKRFSKTGDEIKEAWAPGELGFEKRVMYDMFVVTIVIGYSVIAPIIIPFGAVYFGLGWLVLRNQVLKVYVPSHETYGKMWPCINTQIVAALFAFQFTMFVAFDLKSLFSASLVVVPLLILSILFDCFCRQRYGKFFKNMALEATSSEPNEMPNMELIFRSYIPPGFKVDDDHFEGPLSQV